MTVTLLTPDTDSHAAPVTVHADWTYREDDRVTGIMLFSLSPAQDQALTAQGREPQFLLTASAATDEVTAYNDYSDDRFEAHGTIDTVTTAAAQWLGLSVPLGLKVQREYQDC
jgi:hypothetical protein